MASTMGQQKLVTKAVQSGARDFVFKPFHADRVLDTVINVLNNGDCN